MASSQSDVDRIKAMINEAKHNFSVIEKDINNINWSMLELSKKIKSARGKINFRKGVAKENEIRARVRKNLEKGMFPEYTLEGDVCSVNFANSGGTACQIDVYAKLSKKQGRKKHSFNFIAEAKNTKSKISLADAKKFVASIARLKDEKKLKDISAMYISTAGFAKAAQKYLESFKIKCVNTF